MNSPCELTPDRSLEPIVAGLKTISGRAVPYLYGTPVRDALSAAGDPCWAPPARIATSRSKAEPAVLIELNLLVEPLVTHRYEGLRDIPRAFSGEHRQAGYVKGVVLVTS